MSLTLPTWQAEWLIDRLEKFGAGLSVETEVSEALYQALGKEAPLRY